MPRILGASPRWRMLPGAPSRLPSSFPLRRALGLAHPGEPLGAWVRMGRWPLHLRAGGCALLASADLGLPAPALRPGARPGRRAARGARRRSAHRLAHAADRGRHALPARAAAELPSALPRPSRGRGTHRPAARASTAAEPALAACAAAAPARVASWIEYGTRAPVDSRPAEVPRLGLAPTPGLCSHLTSLRSSLSAKSSGASAAILRIDGEELTRAGARVLGIWLLAWLAYRVVRARRPADRDRRGRRRRLRHHAPRAPRADHLAAPPERRAGWSSSPSPCCSRSMSSSTSARSWPAPAYSASRSRSARRAWSRTSSPGSSSCSRISSPSAT